MKHVCVGDSLAIREDGSLLVSGTFSEEEVLALAHRTFDQMESWVQDYCDIDRRSKQPRLLLRPEPFTRNLVFSHGRFERLGVRLNKKNVIDLIVSNVVWRDDKGIAIRELVQNAVEACRYRSYNSSKADAYAPAVTVIFDRAERSVNVSDNSCGMAERTVLNNFHGRQLQVAPTRLCRYGLRSHRTFRHRVLVGVHSSRARAHQHSGVRVL